VQMRLRARWLFWLNLLLPGTAQLVAGRRVLARLAIAAHLLLCLMLVAAAVVGVLDINLLLVFATSPVAINVMSWLLLGYALLYAVLGLNTLALMKLGRLPTKSRLFTMLSSVVVAALLTTGFASASTLAREQASLVGAIFTRTGLVGAADGRFNIMLVGSDSGSDRLGMRTDSVSVLSLDAVTGEALNIGIPRNLQHAPFSEGSPMKALWPKGYNCGSTCLLNAINTDVMNNHQELYPNALADGITPGIQALKEAVQGITGLAISNYVLIDMSGFKGLINALGGVTIDVKSRLPIGGKLDDGSDARSYIEPGLQHMSGTTALWYARSRHGLDGNSDYSRMSRQREVENALIKQVSPAKLLMNFQAIAAVGKKMIKTDISSDMLAAYVNLALKNRGNGMRTLELVPNNGFDMINPNFSAIQAKIKEQLHG
jgi:polyisoprenyl-teichoic acid--peptidoglycan teichoic acid transferase